MTSLQVSEWLRGIEQSRVTHVCPRQVFRSRIGSLRKGLKSRLDFEFVQGPFEVTSKGLALPLVSL